MPFMNNIYLLPDYVGGLLIPNTWQNTQRYK